MALGTDLALAGTASVSTVYSGYPASNANDGNASTSAIAASNQPSWLHIDLGSTQTVGGWGVNNLNPEHAVVVQSSPDGTTWTQRASVSGNTTAAGTFASPVEARHWRLRNAAAQMNLQIVSLFAAPSRFAANGSKSPMVMG